MGSDKQSELKVEIIAALGPGHVLDLAANINDVDVMMFMLHFSWWQPSQWYSITGTEHACVFRSQAPVQNSHWVRSHPIG